MKESKEIIEDLSSKISGKALVNLEEKKEEFGHKEEKKQGKRRKKKTEVEVLLELQKDLQLKSNKSGNRISLQEENFIDDMNYKKQKMKISENKKIVEVQKMIEVKEKKNGMDLLQSKDKLVIVQKPVSQNNISNNECLMSRIIPRGFFTDSSIFIDDFKFLNGPDWEY